MDIMAIFYGLIAKLAAHIEKVLPAEVFENISWIFATPIAD